MPMRLFPHLPQRGGKICGIRSVADYQHCTAQGAAFVGMVFFDKSPRHLSFDEADSLAAVAVPNGPVRVALCVNPDDAWLDAILRHCQPDMVQLHGDESPARVAEIKARYQTPVMKAFRVKNAAAVSAASAYYEVADWLLFDAESGNADMPGGTGHLFDWSLVADLHPPVPWMLAGGLTPQNLPRAMKQTPACYFDVSSAVERQKGIKDHQLITDFLSALK